MPRKSVTRDMTRGPILKQIILFSLPLMLGNIFQMLYNTVDSIVVGNFVGKEALAAVGATTMIVNMLVFFFNGFSVGAGVVIAQHFGARDMDRLHTAIETTMAMTFVLCAAFTALGLAMVRPMLRLMATPDDVFEDAVTYLSIYFAGFAGLLIYNMGSGILRAVGDTTRPLMFLILTSVLNIILDLAFVVGLKAGIAGVAYATIIAQAISAALTLGLLTRARDIYRLVWRDLSINLPVLRRIFAVGLPAGIQSVITAFSNVFVQSYINFFGSSCMAGWSCYNKLDQFIMLPMQSMAMAATTFVSQNIGANQTERADRGTLTTILLSVAITGGVGLLIYIFATPAVQLFTQDTSVIEYGVLFIRANTFLPAVQLRQPYPGRRPARPRRLQRPHDHHALILRRHPPGLPVRADPLYRQYPLLGGLRLPRGLDDLLRHRGHLLPPPLEAQARSINLILSFI